MDYENPGLSFPHLKRTRSSIRKTAKSLIRLRIS